MRAAIAIVWLLGCAPETSFTDEERALLATLAPDPLPAPPPDVSNTFADDPAAAALGRSLFFERALSGALLDADNDGGPNALGNVGETGRVSCEGCHIEGSGFADTRSTFQQISLGTGWTHRRTPSLLDVGHVPVIMWGGRHSTLHSQIFGPIENPLEMNSSRLYVATYVRDHYRAEYDAVFGASSLEAIDGLTALGPDETGCRLTRTIERPRALPPDPIYACRGMPGDGADYDALSIELKDAVTRVVINAGKAIAAFERTLACGPGRFDAFVRGDASALDEEEQEGLALFIGRAGCVSCHSGPHLTDHAFHNVGLAERPTSEGIINGGDRGAVVDLAAAAADPLGITGPYSDGDDGRLPAPLPEHEGAFRTPSLRCVSDRPTFMHSGLLVSLDEVVEHFDRGGDRGGYPGTSVIEPLGLEPEERRALVAFLEAL